MRYKSCTSVGGKSCPPTLDGWMVLVGGIVFVVVVGWGWEGSSSIRVNPLTRCWFDGWFVGAMATMVAAASTRLDLFVRFDGAPPRRSVDSFGNAAP